MERTTWSDVARHPTFRDMETSKQFAIQSFAKQLLDVADNLSRALASVPPEALEKKVRCGAGVSL